MLFYTHLVWGFALTDFFGDHGWLEPRAVQLVLKDSRRRPAPGGRMEAAQCAAAGHHRVGAQQRFLAGLA